MQSKRIIRHPKEGHSNQHCADPHRPLSAPKRRPTLYCAIGFNTVLEGECKRLVLEDYSLNRRALWRKLRMYGDVSSCRKVIRSWVRLTFALNVYATVWRPAYVLLASTIYLRSNTTWLRLSGTGKYHMHLIISASLFAKQASLFHGMVV